MQVRILLLIVLSWNYIISSRAEEFRIIYIIHGDGNYLYHDSEGKAIDASLRILDQACNVAEQINRGEVFIFYQKPVKFFLFFSKDDGEFHYYKNGKKISEETYSRKHAFNYEIEAELVKNYSEEGTAHKTNILLYYGHEIPDKISSDYHISYSEKEFGISVFAEGINRIINNLKAPEGKFDLVVLSTCRNGNESIAASLASITDYLVASPGDIHLSYMNSRSLISITGKELLSTDYISREFAQSAFDELTSEASTEISINVYDLRNTNGNNSSILNLYRAPKFGKNRGTEVIND